MPVRRVLGVSLLSNFRHLLAFPSNIARLEPSLLNHTISTNLSGAFYATQSAARQMALAQSPPGGSIIGISSISALVGGAQQTHYTPTKAGVTSLMQSCAVALGKYNIRCNALLPGTIRTQLNDADMADPEKRSYMEGRIPLGRLGQPPDLAGPAVFLACEELSSYVVSAFTRLSSCVLLTCRIDWCTAVSRRWIIRELAVENIDFTVFEYLQIIKPYAFIATPPQTPCLCLSDRPRRSSTPSTTFCHLLQETSFPPPPILQTGQSDPNITRSDPNASKTTSVHGCRRSTKSEMSGSSPTDNGASSEKAPESFM